MNPTKRKKLARLKRARETNQPVMVEEEAPEPVAGLRYPEPVEEVEVEKKPAATKKPATKKPVTKKKSAAKKITEIFGKE